MYIGLPAARAPPPGQQAQPLLSISLSIYIYSIYIYMSYVDICIYHIYIYIITYT